LTKSQEEETPEKKAGVVKTERAHNRREPRKKEGLRSSKKRRIRKTKKKKPMSTGTEGRNRVHRSGNASANEKKKSEGWRDREKKPF